MTIFGDVLVYIRFHVFFLSADYADFFFRRKWTVPPMTARRARMPR